MLKMSLRHTYLSFDLLSRVGLCAHSRGLNLSFARLVALKENFLLTSFSLADSLGNGLVACLPVSFPQAFLLHCCLEVCELFQVG